MPVPMASELIPPYRTARFALLGPIVPLDPIVPSGDDGQIFEWRIIIRCQQGEMLEFHQVAMGAGPIEVAKQMKEEAEALFRSSGYEIKQSPTTMEAWTATWDVISAPNC